MTQDPRARPLPAVRRFLRDSGGMLSIEAVIVLPVLVLTLLACFSYFDGLRQYNVNIKAAHTMGDLLSRETAVIDEAYMDGMHEVLKFLVRSPTEPRMRVSVISYDRDAQAFALEWSKVRGSGPALTQASLATIEDRLPDAFGGSQLIVVETSTDYAAPFLMGLGDTVLRNFVVTRLRFVPALAFDGVS